MDKGILLGIIGGLAVFIVLVSFIIISNYSDFDVQLIEQVDDGVPANELMLQIEKETENLKYKVRKRFESNVMDKKYWGNGNLASTNDYQYYSQNYQNEIKMINEYDNVRKKFAKKEISKDEFIYQIENFREYFKLYL